MKILIVGGGGREHALAWKLRRDDPDAELIAAPGNPGIATLARCIPVAADDIDGLVALAKAEHVDLVVVGPEAPLEKGLVDRLSDARIPAFGPTAAAARIETSKRFAKDLMLRSGIPTARASSHTDVASASRAARELGAPVVIKASGLAAGKGVIVCATIDEAERAISDILGGAFGSAGSEILVEEFMEGEELSIFAITDGANVLPMLGAQDHKRLLDGDRGPNTGGMGAYAPVSLGAPELVGQVVAQIFEPTLLAMREAGCPFTGLLYAGLMLTRDGPKVVEFNCRFGDPETEAILPLLESSLLDVMLAVAKGDTLAAEPSLRWKNAFAVTTVVASAGYPERKPISVRVDELPEDSENLVAFHAGTRRSSNGFLETSGGRVFAVTGIGSSFLEAQSRSREAASAVLFEGAHYRSDIGWRETRRASVDT